MLHKLCNGNLILLLLPLQKKWKVSRLEYWNIFAVENLCRIAAEDETARNLLERSVSLCKSEIIFQIICDIRCIVLLSYMFTNDLQQTMFLTTSVHRYTKSSGKSQKFRKMILFKYLSINFIFAKDVSFGNLI